MIPVLAVYLEVPQIMFLLLEISAVKKFHMQISYFLLLTSAWFALARFR